MKYGALLWNKLKIDSMGTGPSGGHITFIIPFKMYRAELLDGYAKRIRVAFESKLKSLDWPHSISYDGIEVQLQPAWNEGRHEARVTLWGLCSESYDFYTRLFNSGLHTQ